jgi:hypothetical protein
LNEAISLADEIGAIDTVGRAKLAMGLLHKAKRRNKQARECLADAIEVFEKCGADGYLLKAKEALGDLS